MKTILCIAAILFVSAVAEASNKAEEKVPLEKN